MRTPLTPSFPAIRACIFDLDGLLINTEDIITTSINRLLAKYERPPMTRGIRAQLMGIANSSNSDAFHDWARLPISREQWARESKEEFRRNFPNCAPLPGAEALVAALGRASASASSSTTTTSSGEGGRHEDNKQKIKLALASGTTALNYALKTSSSPETQKLLSFFPPEHRVLGDDPRLPAKGSGRGKPAPDIYLVALQTLNAVAEAGGEQPILPRECLVFEDSVVGVEAGRRAGMRVVWVPHPDMAIEYRGREEVVLAGRTGMVEIGEAGQLGEVDDGWAEMILSLEHFDYAKFGMVIGS
ncbi:hypothetical protein PG993_003668 [Apiospora rasikravindrae]|uniref:Uncharacterized protein n=1 Tax=Apiospora rasikravindrae TaxID=990691 RepID=A0ABR1U0E1_9PEZI